MSQNKYLALILMISLKSWVLRILNLQKSSSIRDNKRTGARGGDLEYIEADIALIKETEADYVVWHYDLLNLWYGLDLRFLLDHRNLFFLNKNYHWFFRNQ